MSFDGNIVKKITKELYESLNTGRINKIYQLSKYDLLFVINSKTGKKQLKTRLPTNILYVFKKTFRRWNNKRYLPNHK